MQVGIGVSVPHHRRLPVPTQVLLLQDGFVGTNEDALLDRVPPTRPNANVWGVTAGTWAINNNRAEARFAASSTAALLHFDLGRDELDVRSTLLFPATGTNRQAGIFCRRTNSNNYIHAVINFASSLFRLIDFTAGTPTVLDEVAFTAQAAVAYTVRLVLIGDNFYATVNDDYLLEATTAVRDGTNFCGLRAVNSVGGGAIQFENIDLYSAPASFFVSGQTFLMEDGVPMLSEDNFRLLMENDI